MKKSILILFCVLSLSALTMSAGELNLSMTVPQDDAANVSTATGIVLMFDENLVLGAGDCLLNGEIITPSLTAKMARFNLTGLEYSTTYTFEAPAGAFIGKSSKNTSPAISFRFTTADRPLPEPKVFDAIVSKDSTGNFLTIQEAIDKAPVNRTRPYLIFVRNGHYKEVVRVPENKPFIHLIGEDVDSTIVEYKLNCGWSEGYAGPKDDGFDLYAQQFNYAFAPHNNGFYSIAYIAADNFYSENISYVNLWGREDRDFPQALSVWTEGDKSSFYNCKAYSYQDTWRTPGSSQARQYVKNCFIEGNVDFIYASGNVLFDSCTISIIKNRKSFEEAGWIVAPSQGSDSKWGYVFLNNKLIGEQKGDSIYLGRGWHSNPKAVFINLQLDDKIVLRDEGWDAYWAVVPTIFADYNTMDCNGNPVDRSKRIDQYWLNNAIGDTTWFTVKNSLTEDEVSSYNFKNIIAGTDSWRPDIMMERLPAPELYYNGNQLYWETIPYAICYEIRRCGQFVGFTTSNNYAFESQPEDYTVRAVNEYGARGQLSAPARINRLETNRTGNPIRIRTFNGNLVNLGDKQIRVQMFSLLGHRTGDGLLEAGESMKLDDNCIVRVFDGKSTLVLKNINK